MGGEGGERERELWEGEHYVANRNLKLLSSCLTYRHCCVHVLQSKNTGLNINNR